jgi:hypothetical protein
MEWAKHVARIGERRDAYRFMFWKPEEGDNFEDQGMYARIILKLILRK